ncbi:hypothetical protein [Chryseobacterium sp. Leaf394]|uniref:hypothetical protein n=1 Tax=Chryseobacterium sp. Leaf394 TaxID=1736361 RepID=UPI0006F4DF19|nr:hypothetical protein [Chryseobacterium sp. Leaf394]KQS92586.1 hypothetical protein ASG21_09160 [Chryseobacterium sp. Leaf394]
MKLIYLLIGIFLLQSCGRKKLNEDEILEIIHSNESYENMNLKKDFLTGNEFIDSTTAFKKILNQENFKPIYEADFNNDGKKDYLLNLADPRALDNNNVVKPHISEHNYNSALLISGNKSYRLLNPGKGRIYEVIASKIIQFNNQPLIKLISYHQGFDNSFHLFDIDTLMIKNNELMEYYSDSKKHTVEKIIFTKNEHFPPVRLYQLTLTKDSLILHSDHYKNLKGNFSGDGYYSFEKMVNGLNQVNFIKINEKYPFSNDDFSESTEIIFDNGKSKKFYDYNGKRYLFLMNFYEKIDTLISNQKWTEIIHSSKRNNR